MDNLPSEVPVEVEIDPRAIGTCECCPATEVRLNKYHNMLMCDICKNANERVDNPTPEQAAEAEQRVQEHRAAWDNNKNLHLEHIRKENAALRMSSDIFNAKISSIVSLKKAIDDDPNIENKNFMLAQVLQTRFEHLNNLLNDKHQEIVEAENEQRAIQSYYNDLSTKLRTEEREKIKLADLKYKPAEIKSQVKKEPKKKNWDKTSVAAMALISGYTEQMLTMICMQRDIAPAMAVKILAEAGIKAPKK